MEAGDFLARLVDGREEIVVACLKELNTKGNVDEELAKKLGPSVNIIRKNTVFKEASPLATSLLQKWKPLLMVAPSKDPGVGAEVRKPVAANTIKTKSYTRDPVRVKSMDLFKSVLEEDVELAEDLEEALFDEFTAVNADYKAKVRSKYLNLKQNKSLKEQLLTGTLTPSRFVEMTAAEMASADLKEADAASQAKALRDTQAAQDTEAETDQFKCGRCGKRRCKYYQLQTRSADEPMTTFVTCVNCGNRWKFS